jgi:Xaa-Pro aminopeptidase
VHGNGVHLDDYETHDDRRLLPGTGFTIEPGLYFDTFGVRTEINMYRDEREARVTGPRQMEIITLAVDGVT